MPRDKLNSKKVPPFHERKEHLEYGYTVNSFSVAPSSSHILVQRLQLHTLSEHFYHVLLPIDPHLHQILHLNHSQFNMISSIFLPLAFAVCQVSSSPIHQRRALSQNDIIGLQLAGYLENLELSLYTGGCEGFTDVEWIAAGFPSTFQQDICAIAEVRLPDLSFTQLLT